MDTERALERIDSVIDSYEDRDRFDDQREAYRKTFRTLREIDPTDGDEGVVVVTDWVVDRIESGEGTPSSRAVRRRAREFCHANDYQIPDDSWLGVCGSWADARIERTRGHSGDGWKRGGQAGVPVG